MQYFALNAQKKAVLSTIKKSNVTKKESRRGYLTMPVLRQ